MMSEKESLAPKRPEPPPSSPLADQTLYHDSTQTPRAVSSNSLFEGRSTKLCRSCKISSWSVFMYQLFCIFRKIKA